MSFVSLSNRRTQTLNVCNLCKVTGVTEQEFELLSDLTDHLEGISDDDDMNLFYAAGYIAFKHKNLRGRYSDYEALDESSAFLTERGSWKTFISI